MRSRRHYPPEFKTRAVLDIPTAVQSQAEICREHTLSPNLVALSGKGTNRAAHNLLWILDTRILTWCV